MENISVGSTSGLALILIGIFASTAPSPKKTSSVSTAKSWFNRAVFSSTLISVKNKEPLFIRCLMCVDCVTICRNEKIEIIVKITLILPRHYNQ